MRGLFLMVLMVIMPLAMAEETANLSDFAQTKAAVPSGVASDSAEYKIGNDDILEISVFQPELIALTVTVSPDGSITFPYIGKVDVKGRTLAEIQYEIQRRLADGYLKYPVVSVAVKESRSKKFFMYGEILKPGTYPLEANMTVIRAISMAGGFTKYGSPDRVKILRPKDKGAGYDTIKVNINAIMNSSSGDDVLILSGDIIVVTEGMF